MEKVWHVLAQNNLSLQTICIILDEYDISPWCGPCCPLRISNEILLRKLLWFKVSKVKENAD